MVIVIVALMLGWILDRKLQNSQLAETNYQLRAQEGAIADLNRNVSAAHDAIRRLAESAKELRDEIAAYKKMLSVPDQ